jgi:hypothetical protein
VDRGVEGEITAEIYVNIRSSQDPGASKYLPFSPSTLCIGHQIKRAGSDGDAVHPILDRFIDEFLESKVNLI